MNASTIASIIRHTLGIASGWLLARGIELDSGTIEIISGAVGSLVAVGWSIWSKRQVEKP
jgi:hypothetical protein